MVLDRDFTSAWVEGRVPGLLDDPIRLRQFGEKAWGYGIRDAADVMAGKVLELAR